LSRREGTCCESRMPALGHTTRILSAHEDHLSLAEGGGPGFGVNQKNRSYSIHQCSSETKSLLSFFFFFPVRLCLLFQQTGTYLISLCRSTTSNLSHIYLINILRAIHNQMKEDACC
jgi:hypothetical protein